MEDPPQIDWDGIASRADWSPTTVLAQTLAMAERGEIDKVLIVVVGHEGRIGIAANVKSDLEVAGLFGLGQVEQHRRILARPGNRG